MDRLRNLRGPVLPERLRQGHHPEKSCASVGGMDVQRGTTEELPQDTDDTSEKLQEMVAKLQEDAEDLGRKDQALRMHLQQLDNLSDGPLPLDNEIIIYPPYSADFNTKYSLKSIYENLRVINKKLWDVQIAIYRLSYVDLQFLPRDKSNYKPHAGSAPTSSVYDQPLQQALNSIEGFDLPQDHVGWGVGHGFRDWYSACHRFDLLGSRASIEDALRELDQIRVVMTAMQKNCWSMAALVSRPSLRSLGLLDLPDEILASIFELAAEPWNDEYHLSRDIANCRLACRTMCRLSSRFLLRSVAVDVRATSIARLQEISCHPVFSKGVRSVKVIINYYPREISVSLRAFAEYHCRQLEIATTTLGARLRRRPETIPDIQNAKTIINEANDIIHGWHRAAREDQAAPAAGKDVQHQLLIRRAFEDYQKLYRDSHDLRHIRNFFFVIANAMAVMPFARRLVLCDDVNMGPRRLPSFHDCLDVSSRLYVAMLEPWSYRAGTHAAFAHKGCEIYFDLPVAIHHAGVTLEDLDVKLSSLAVFMPSQEVIKEIPAALAGLRRFSLDWKGHWYHGHWKTTALSELLNPILTTMHLEDLSVKFEASNQTSRDASAVTSDLVLRSWPKLSRLSLMNVALSLSDLEACFTGSRTCLTHLTLNKVTLCEGHWEQALRVLRNESIRYVCVSYPSGADFDRFSTKEDVYYASFDKHLHHIDHMNGAEKYLRGFVSRNPLEGRDTHSADREEVGLE
ncbi:hypothetical protein S40285_05659 [Stachybotrys chlorohalonatus IBT 40285]|uniref:F-box domain-containing protein n=1 Tax=Stachybotrys chlorohalonatus (strain IBT 40285) TaxID=1283841 RepID=A0A084QZV7_STAC4|nr:hypothetical protein S40285_05659 [Stachybotrys chlorohalonata IBT 40285]